MKQRIKKLWVEALRSGEYEQGRGVLHNYTANTYCCLGVLCRLYDDMKKKDDADFWFDWMDESGDHYPAEEVMNWAKLETSQAVDLAELNDRLSSSFAQIADIIEQKY